MSKRSKPTCRDCYFGREGLCALAGEAICPTFRAVRKGAIAAPQQPQLVPRTQAAVAA